MHSSRASGTFYSLIAVSLGNALEWFDWTIYSSFSYYLSANLFDASDKTSALLLTFAVFASGFVARPIGGWLFGAFGDRLGRKGMLFLTMGLLFGASLLIAIIPSYAAIGSLASLALLVCRLIQGLAHGGESGLSYTYIAEMAPAERRGLWSSAIFVSGTIGAIAATALAAALTASLGREAMVSYGWRIGFAIGAILGLIVLVLRRNTGETQAFEALQQHPEVLRTVTAYQKLVIFRNIILCAAAGNAIYYTWVTFVPTIAISKGMAPSSAYTASLLAQLVCVAWLPVAGWLSDKLGRKPILLLFGIGVIAGVKPIASILTEQPWTLFVGQAAGMCIWALNSAMFPALVAEQAPTSVRARGVGLVTSLSAAVFGGTAPYLNVWLTSIGQGYLFQYYVMGLGLLACVGALTIRESARVNIRDLGAETDGASGRSGRGVTHAVLRP